MLDSGSLSVEADLPRVSTAVDLQDQGREPIHGHLPGLAIKTISHFHDNHPSGHNGQLGHDYILVARSSLRHNLTNGRTARSGLALSTTIASGDFLQVGVEQTEVDIEHSQ